MSKKLRQAVAEATDYAFKAGAFVLLLIIASIVTLAVAVPSEPKWLALPALLGAPVFYFAQTWVVACGPFSKSGNSWNLKAAAFLVLSAEAVALIVLW